MSGGLVSKASLFVEVPLFFLCARGPRLLPMSVYTDLFAEALDRASAAPRADGFAQRLAEGDEDVVDGNPPFFGEFLSESHLGLFGCFGLDVSQPVGDAVDVGVDADAEFVVSEGEDEVGCLPADAGEGEEFVQVVGDTAAVLFDEDATDAPYVFGFRFVEPDGIDELLYLFGSEFEDGLGCFGFFKKPPGRHGRDFVLRPQTEHRGDEDAERVPRPLRDLGDDGHVPFRDLCLEDGQDFVEGLCIHFFSLLSF